MNADHRHRWTPERVAELVRLHEQEKWEWARIGAHFGIGGRAARLVYLRKHVYPKGLPRQTRESLSDRLRDKELGRLLAENAALKERVAALEQLIKETSEC